MLEIKLIPEEEFQRVRDADIKKYDKLGLLADMCRANAWLRLSEQVPVILAPASVR
jgi:hypothetical protein